MSVAGITLTKVADVIETGVLNPATRFKSHERLAESAVADKRGCECKNLHWNRVSVLITFSHTISGSSVETK